MSITEVNRTMLLRFAPIADRRRRAAGRAPALAAARRWRARWRRAQASERAPLPSRATLSRGARTGSSREPLARSACYGFDGAGAGLEAGGAAGRGGAAVDPAGGLGAA